MAITYSCPQQENTFVRLRAYLPDWPQDCRYGGTPVSNSVCVNRTSFSLFWLDARAQNCRIVDRPTPKDLYINVASPVIRGSFYFFSRHPFILLDGNKPAAAIFASPQIPLFLLVSDSAKDIKIYLEAISFTTVRAKFCWHTSAPFQRVILFVQDQYAGSSGKSFTTQLGLLFIKAVV